MNFLKNAGSLDRPIYTVYVHPENKHQRLILDRVSNYRNPLDPLKSYFNPKRLQHVRNLSDLKGVRSRNYNYGEPDYSEYEPRQRKYRYKKK
jgi:hypothetical protein